MGQSGPKINPVWAGGTVAEHGLVAVTSELRDTVHRALFIRKMDDQFRWYCLRVTVAPRKNTAQPVSTVLETLKSPYRLKYQGQGYVVTFG